MPIADEMLVDSTAARSDVLVIYGMRWFSLSLLKRRKNMDNSLRLRKVLEEGLC